MTFVEKSCLAIGCLALIIFCYAFTPTTPVGSINHDTSHSVSGINSLKFKENIADYYYLFGLKTPLKDFKDLDYEATYKAKSYRLYNLDYKNAFLGFHTCNTPPNWDGDSKTEMYYSMTYWNLKNNRRIIALVVDEVTLVSSETQSVRFYMHDETGVHEIHWDDFKWNIGDFIGQDKVTLFNNEIWNNPLVFVQLPQKGKVIEVSLALHEDMEDIASYNTYDSLNIGKAENILKFNPTEFF